MNSLDTNILYYATNMECPEHARAKDFLENAAREPADWIVADQVLVEYYRLVRNPSVLEKPLSGQRSGAQASFLPRGNRVAPLQLRPGLLG